MGGAVAKKILDGRRIGLPLIERCGRPRVPRRVGLGGGRGGSVIIPNPTFFGNPAVRDVYYLVGGGQNDRIST